jgi:hypothetical protein
MSTQVATYDVFLSYSLPDARTAELVERALEEGGLDVFNVVKVEPGEGLQDLVWRALAESAALVVVVSSQDNLASSVVVEVGAFLAWHKPIYIIHAAKGGTKLPSYLAKFQAYPISRVDDVVQSVKRDLQPLSDQDRAVLSDIYVTLGIPTDKLLGQAASIEELAREFESKSGRRVAGERLVQELVRMRKYANLPRLRS